MKPKRYETVRILLETSRVIGSSLDFDKVARLVLKKSMDALKVDHASLFLADEATGRLMLVKARGFSRDELDNIKILASWEDVNSQLVKRKRAIVVNDVKGWMRIGSFLAVPLKKEDTSQVIGALIVSNDRRRGYRFTPSDVELLTGLSNYISVALINARLYETLKNLFLSTVKSLITAVDAKDRYTGGHSERVMRYAVAISRSLRLDDDALENLRLSSLLHDVGKIGINDTILSKPASLATSEKRHMRDHPLIGLHIIESIDKAHRIVRGIAEHHEWFNGKGYPNHLMGKAISLEGRIIAVADAYDALTTKRPYRRAFSTKETVMEIEKGSNTQFDPRIVKAFKASFSKYPAIWEV